MAKLTDLGLSNDKVGGDVDLENLPKMGGFTAMFQPGRYRFKLPANLNDVFDKVDSQKGPRITAIFDQDNPLLVVKSPGDKRNGEPFSVRISNVERERGREKILASDMDFLLKALGHKKPAGTRWSNLDYAKALITHAGQEFDATVEVSYSCNDRKNIRVDNGAGSTEEVEGKPGCGARYYQKDVADLKDPATGEYPERITCSGNDGNCGASLRGFGQFGSIG